MIMITNAQTGSKVATSFGAIVRDTQLQKTAGGTVTDKRTTHRITKAPAF